ncbi:TetR/AcrR family transcriptional regulator [Bailinhaonella thermotolerans]|uniref:TetR/AcrR family transcriptional regulator n=1 Tax=Bailinhaonella thermotolerans TaxID=1070861 RepID=A0A3A4BJB9_9ACTN|nr:TetR/AcrR family transcriptional regulator [Bailinhaonella thermotolerans]RJL35324.1 TetR/AcrR family transcriptional regulator [Bailinhaonella thermotolerans]
MADPKRLRPRKTPRQQRSADTVERILQAAARVFVEHGYAAGTTNRIAEAANLSIGSLYQYFPNKDAILIQLVRRHIDDGTAAIGKILERPLPDTLEAKLDLFIAAAIDAHRGDPRLHRVIFEESPRPPALLAELHALHDTAVGHLAAMLDIPRLTAWFVITTIESLTHRYIGDHPEPDYPAFHTELRTMLTTYLEHTAAAVPSRCDDPRLTPRRATEGAGAGTGSQDHGRPGAGVSR